MIIIGKQILRRFDVTVDQDGGIASLKSHRETLEKLFYFQRVTLSPSTRVLNGNLLQGFDGIGIPSAECFDDQRLEFYPLGATVVEMFSDFGSLAHCDGGSGSLSGE